MTAQGTHAGRLKVGLAMIAGLVVLGSALVASGAEVVNTVLDWSASYWRHYLTFRPPRYDPPVKDLKGRTLELLRYCRGWHIAPMQGLVHSADPAAGWRGAEFDDGAWCRERGGPTAGSGWYDPVVAAKYLRGRFEVGEMGKASGLTLEVEYIGGVAAWLNGVEIGRGHLPMGDPTGDTLAEGYPVEAYEWDIPINKYNYPVPPAEWEPRADKKTERWRRLEVSIDSRLLRKGTNVLAVSLHRSGYHAFAGKWHTEAMNGYRLTPWPHLLVRKLRLTAAPQGAARPEARPVGLQFWVEDINRRVLNRDFGESGGGPLTVRMVGARNGTCSGQVVVGTSAAVEALSAACGELVPVGGAGRIPATTVRVRYGVPTTVDSMWGWSGGTERPREPLGITGRLRARYAGVLKPPTEKESNPLALFDHLSERPPKAVPAESCQPVWVTVKVPRDAPAGEYRGTLRIKAGSVSAEAEVRLWVMDWSLPDSRDFASFVGLEQGLWAPCAEYKAPPWSDEHWRLLERSMQLMAEVGADVAVLPLICDGTAGNAESLVPWMKDAKAATEAGPYGYDWKNFDRYLALVAKHWGKQVSVVAEICGAPYSSKGWVLKHGAVTALDPPSGKSERLALPPAASDDWKKVFPPFAQAVRERVRSKGFERLFWGWFHDNSGPVQPLATALAESCPDVGWARSSHDGFRKRPFLPDSKAANLDMHIRGFPQSFDKSGAPVSRCGWKNPGNVLFPRTASEIMAFEQFDSPTAFRHFTENCLVNGAAGFGRIGADYWPSAMPPYNWYGLFVRHLLHPGPDGAEGGVVFEALREGVQEAEVRIALEAGEKDHAEPAKSVLAERVRRLGVLEAGVSYSTVSEYYGGWQERSWELYAAAAAAFGGKAPTADDRARFFAKAVAK